MSVMVIFRQLSDRIIYRTTKDRSAKLKTSRIRGTQIVATNRPQRRS
jgi:hypothetical protein